jgi:hypothetical protein
MAVRHSPAAAAAFPWPWKSGGRRCGRRAEARPAPPQWGSHVNRERACGFEERGEVGADGSSRLKQEQCNSGGLLCIRSCRRWVAVGGRRLHDRGDATGKEGTRRTARERTSSAD